MLTDTAIKKAKPKDKAFKLCDSGGLYLFFMPSGYRSWRMKFRFAGKEKRLVFGSYPDTTLLQARAMHENAAKLLRDGVDPSVHKVQQAAAQVARVGATFKTIAEDWLVSQDPSWSKRYAHIVSDSGRRRSLHARSAAASSQRIQKPSHGARYRRSNAATGGANGRGRSHRIAQGRGAAGSPVDQAGVAFPFTHSCALRVLRLAEPNEFEGVGGMEPIGRIPAAKMRLVVDQKEDAAFELIVPLSRQAVEPIAAAMEFIGKRPLIFRSVRHPRQPLSDSALSRTYREAGFTGLHEPHGWRSTFSTVMNELAGVESSVGDLAIIDLMLAHVPSNTVEAAYNRAAYMSRARWRRNGPIWWCSLVPLELLLTGLWQHA